MRRSTKQVEEKGEEGRRESRERRERRGDKKGRRNRVHTEGIAVVTQPKQSDNGE